MILQKLEKCDLSLIECWKKVSLERLKREIDVNKISFRRFTKALANLIMSDVEIYDRILNAEIKNDKSNGHE